jgi:energy-converting hydrogenase Eha subunit E
MNVLIALLQGIYFFVTGIWPLISINTFMKITGPKTDLWLVKTVGCILAVIGGTLIFAYTRSEVNASVAFMAMGSAAVLALVEFNYVTKRVISPVYLLDAFAEIIIIAWWIIAMSI